MRILLRTTALLAALALLGATVAEARGGRSSVRSSRSGGSSFSRSARSPSSSFSRAARSSSSFSRSRPSRSFSSPSRTVRSPSRTVRTPSPSYRSTPQVQAPRSVPSVARSRVRTPSTRSTTTPTIRSNRSVPSTRSYRTPSSTPSARSAAVQERLRTWSRSRTTGADAAQGVRSTRSFPTTRTPSTRTPSTSPLRTRVPQRTAASSRGDTTSPSFAGSRSPSAQADRLRDRFGGTGSLRVTRARSALGDGTRTFGAATTRSGSTRSGSDLRSIARQGRLVGDVDRGTVSPSYRTSSRTRSGAARFGGSRGSVRSATAGAGAGRHLTTGPRGSVRYSGGTGGYHGHGPAYYHRPYRSYYWRWRDYWYYGYPVRSWGWGVGFTIAYWDPWYYNTYASFWVGGAPAFGFGTVYYGPAYSTYFAEPVVVEQPVYVIQEEPVYVEPEGAVAPAAGVQPAPVAPPVVEEGAAPEAAPPADAPGYADFEAGVEAFLDGDYEAALVHFRAAAQADEKNGEAWMALAHAAFATGGYEEAAVAIAQAANLGAFPRGYRYDPKPMYPQEGRFEDLLGKLKVWRAKHPDDANAALVAAYFHVALGEQTEASQALTQVLQLRPDDETAPILTLAMLPPLPPEPSPEDAPVAPTADR